MRLIVLAFTLLPVMAHAQSTTAPTPTEPVAQACPAGMTFNTATQSCGLTPATSPAMTPMPAASGGSDCGFSAARDVTS